MNSPYKFVPQARLLDFMRQAGNPDLINLAAGLPSVDCVPKAALKRAFDAAFSEEPDVALGYHTPDGDYQLRERIASRFARESASRRKQLSPTLFGKEKSEHHLYLKTAGLSGTRWARIRIARFHGL